MKLEPSPARIALVLGSLGALGPLAIDMYLPALPVIAADLHVDEGAIQLSLIAFFAGLMLGQLFYGPLSDRTGRKPMIYVGLALFIGASLGCAFAATAGQLVAWRFAQGLGGAIGMVIGLAVVRDLYMGRTAARLVAWMMIVLGVAPILAPLIGTFITSFLPWQALFVVLALFGVASGALVGFALPETRAAELRTPIHPDAVLHRYLHLALSRRYIPYVAASAIAQAGFFAYLSGSSFIFISLHGLSPTVYSLIFALNAFGLMAGAQLGPALMGRFQPQVIVRTALAAYTVAALALTGLELAGGAGLVALSALLFVVITSVSFVRPLCGVMALEAYGAISGTAAALMGAFQFGAGTLAALAVSLAANGTAFPMIATIAVSGTVSCLVAFSAFPKPQPLLQGGTPI
ncbi:MAG: multidrug effflux MFS transporter [Pseudomonas sp.]|nr:multidrug effflux MFS transporter [Pseudomonas sp.]